MHTRGIQTFEMLKWLLVILLVGVSDASRFPQYSSGKILQKSIYPTVHSNVRLSHLKPGASLRPVEQSPPRVDSSTVTGYLSFAYYSGDQCTGSVYMEIVTSTGICVTLNSGKSESTVASQYGNAISVITSFYDDSSCNILNASYPAFFSNNGCQLGLFSLRYSTSKPSPPSHAGIIIETFLDSAECQDGAPVIESIYTATEMCVYSSAKGTSSLVTACSDAGAYAKTFNSTGCLPEDLMRSDLVYSSLLAGQCILEPNSTMFYSSACVAASTGGDSPTCFAATETVQLESGAVVPMTEVQLGDRVLSSDKEGGLLYSEVIAIPHDSNDVMTDFIRITVSSGADIQLTTSHLIATAAAVATDWDTTIQCSADVKLLTAEEIKIGMHLLTTSGLDRVVDVKAVQGRGVVTLVTDSEYIVVNGFVASPFAVNHAVASAFYNIHRAVFRLGLGQWLVPRGQWLRRAVELFSALAHRVASF